jgi:CDP-glycerol glycerophosphotransferase (TagB/SpsB family)
VKVDRNKPAHWLYLIGFTLTTVLATVLRLCRIIGPGQTCLLYGHKLNGNLKAVYDHNLSASLPAGELVFLTMDVDYYRALKNEGFNVLNGTNPFNAAKIAAAYAIVSDHGLHSLSILKRFTRMPFFDVWHAIPLKGFDEDDFRTQQDYEKIFVTSELVKSVYIEKFGMAPSIVEPSGYARTDMLVERPPDLEKIRRDFDIEQGDKKIILLAPTWQQDDPNRDIIPFGESVESFFGAIEQACQRANAICIFRTHLNSDDMDLSKYGSIFFRPHSRYPATEELLLLTDCLVSDWSSIVFDYMLLDRPTLFLDVPHPFQKGFSLGPENRFGKLVGGLEELCSSLQAYLDDPALYTRDYGVSHASIKQDLYDNNADGQAAKRVCGVLAGYKNQAS